MSNDLEQFNDGLRFRAALKAIDKIHAMVQDAGFTKDVFANVEVLEQGINTSEVYRAGIGMNVVAISENLWGIKNKDRWYDIVPKETFQRVRNMRNNVSHHYGHAEKMVDWHDLWEYIANDRDVFIPQLRRAVEKAEMSLNV